MGNNHSAHATTATPFERDESHAIEMNNVAAVGEFPIADAVDIQAFVEDYNYLANKCTTLEKELNDLRKSYAKLNDVATELKTNHNTNQAEINRLEHIRNHMLNSFIAVVDDRKTYIDRLQVVENELKLAKKNENRLINKVVDATNSMWAARRKKANAAKATKAANRAGNRGNRSGNRSGK